MFEIVPDPSNVDQSELAQSQQAQNFVSMQCQGEQCSNGNLAVVNLSNQTNSVQVRILPVKQGDIVPTFTSGGSNKLIAPGSDVSLTVEDSNDLEAEHYFIELTYE
ncbi:hypothetical protein [Paraferrimonas sp. SM1919]|uniref:hypothetical protein n=1 Tax=Paraferrimonas sp. SM1919 TaxID=2662263 RepID=UPI0013CFE38C|nr:hypothetical protein [Paraferrimonas sp. SM1919]